MVLFFQPLTATGASDYLLLCSLKLLRFWFRDTHRHGTAVCCVAVPTTKPPPRSKFCIETHLHGRGEPLFIGGSSLEELISSLFILKLILEELKSAI